MNMAALWKLPVIYVCENNLYNEYTSFEDVTAGSITARAEAFGIPSQVVDGQDVFAVYEAAAAAVERGRRGEGPSFVECKTYRYHGHHVGDVDRSYYRSKDEEEQWARERDPLLLVAARLCDDAAIERLRGQVEAEVAEAVAYALEAPYPDPSEVTEHVYA
jgi:pyruvate dehydrogenase E1 component alpha subunit